MEQQGTTGFGSNSSLLQNTLNVTSGPMNGGADMLSIGRSLAGTAGAARTGSQIGFGAAPQRGGANRGQPWQQRPGQAMRGAPITATAVTTTEGDSGGEFDAANFVYTVVPWNQNANESADTNNQTHLEPGDPVWVQTLVVEQFVLYNMLNAAQINSAIRDNTVVFLARVARQVPEAVKFNEYLRKYGDFWLNLYVEHRDANNLAHLKSLFDDSLLERTYMTELKDMAKMAIHKNYYSLTQYGIRSTWNFVGFVLTTSDPLRMKGIQQFGYSRVLSVNVTVKGNHEAIQQLWPGPKECPAQSKLYFVLTKISTDRGPYTFQYVPWGSRDRESAPYSLCFYRDDAGNLCQGDTNYVGLVHQAPNRDNGEAARLVAAGLIAETAHMQRESGAQLFNQSGACRVQVGIF